MSYVWWICSPIGQKTSAGLLLGSLPSRVLAAVTPLGIARCGRASRGMRKQDCLWRGWWTACVDETYPLPGRLPGGHHVEGEARVVAATLPPAGKHVPQP